MLATRTGSDRALLGARRQLVRTRLPPQAECLQAPVCRRLDACSSLLTPNRHATTMDVQSLWKFVALAPLTWACASETGGSDSAQAADTTGGTVNTLTATATQTASTTGGTSAATVSVT